MPIRTKYRPVIDLLARLNAADINDTEENGALQLSAVVRNEHDRKLVMDKIEEVNYEHAEDIVPRITIKEIQH